MTNPFAAIYRVVRAAVRVAFFTALYEAGKRSSAARTFLEGWVQDQRHDADPISRYEMIRKSRAFEQNNAIANKLADTFEQYTVGPGGLNVIPDTADDAYNEAAAASWNEWVPMANLSSRHGFGSDQGLIARSEFFDGEIFILKTYGRSEFGSRPRIQLIESHRVCTPPGWADRAGIEMIEGIEVDKRNGRPIAYWVQDPFNPDHFDRRLAADIIHVFEPSRTGQYRGLPFLYPVMNLMHDLKDLHTFEMAAAKDEAHLIKVIKTETGALPAALKRRGRFRDDGPAGDDSAAESSRNEYIEKKLAAKTLVLKNTESIDRPPSVRPSVTAQWYWEYIVELICAGVGIPKVIIFPRSMQGTVTRADLDGANSFFKSRHCTIAEAVRQVYEFYMSWARYNDPRLYDGPGDWRKCVIMPPRAVNVDTGRNSNAMLAELAAGATTLQAIFAPLGQDWRVQIRQRAREEKFIDMVAAKEGVSPDRIRDAIGAHLDRVAAQESADTTTEEVTATA